jgi:cysteine desulfurase/selenocysteine lyase
LNYATKQLLAIEDLKIYGTSKNKTSVISFNIGNIHPYDIGTIPGTIRASFAFYNTKEEIDKLVMALLKAKQMLS